MPANVVTITHRGAERLLSGHLWIYRSDVAAAEAEPGAVVRVLDRRQHFWGTALYSSKSQIALRLLSREHRRKLAGIAARMTYVDMSSDPRYMDSYVKAMFLPHTDLERFPTVARMLTDRKRNEA